MVEKEKKLWIVVSEKGMKAWDTLNGAVATFSDLAVFVSEGQEIVCLTHNPPLIDEQWKIESVSLKEIAKVMLERKG